MGTQPTENRSTGIAHELVMRLCNRYLNIGANNTMDNFFTSYALAKELHEKKTNLVGTIRANESELLERFTSAAAAKKRGTFFLTFCLSAVCELVSFTINTKKTVLLLTNAHSKTENAITFSCS